GAHHGGWHGRRYAGAHVRGRGARAARGAGGERGDGGDRGAGRQRGADAGGRGGSGGASVRAVGDGPGRSKTVGGSYLDRLGPSSTVFGICTFAITRSTKPNSGAKRGSCASARNSFRSRSPTPRHSAHCARCSSRAAGSSP